MANVSLFLSDLEERKKNRRRKLRRLVVVGVVVVLGVVGWWSVFQAPWTRVETVEVSGLRRVPEAAVLGMMYAQIQRSFTGSIFGKEHFFAIPRSIDPEIIVAIPNIVGIDIERDFRNRAIRIAVREREPFGIWCFKKERPIKCVWFDDEGIGFEPAPAAEGNLIRSVSDYAQEPVALGEPVIRKEYMKPLASIFAVFQSSSVRVREIEYRDPSLAEIVASTYDGPELFFSLRFETNQAIPVLEDLLTEDVRGKLIPRFRDLEYIDFRVEQRAYYK